MTDEQRREKDFEKIDNIERVVTELASDFKTYSKVTEVTVQNVSDNVQKLSVDIKDQKAHFDGIIDRNKEHFDERIDVCRSELHNVLKTDYATKAEIRSMRDESIIEQAQIRKLELSDLKTDIFSRLKNFGALVAGTVILIFVILTYLVGK